MQLLKRLASTFGFVVAIIGSSLVPVQDAKAGIPVIDAGNLTQNIMSALQTLQSNVNEATQIANQMTSISNEIRNLQQLPAGVANGLLSQYVSQYGQLTTNFNTIDGLARDLGALTTNYQGMFPDRSVGGPVNTAGVMAQVQGWLDQSRRTMRGVYQQSGQVMAALPQASSQVSTILNQSQSSNGGLDGVQAQTQMAGQVANQLIQLNAQTATMYQAQTDLMAQQAQMQDIARRRSIDSRAGFVTPSAQPPAAFLPALR